MVTTNDGWIPIGKQLDKSSLNFRLLDEALNGGKTTDVSLTVDGRKFRAHRNILVMGSPVLEELFQGKNSVKLKQSTCVRANIFEQVLSFLYVGKVESTYVRELLVVADKLEIHSLKQLCEQSLASSQKLTVQTALELFNLAKQCRATELQKATFEFIL